MAREINARKAKIVFSRVNPRKRSTLLIPDRISRPYQCQWQELRAIPRGPLSLIYLGPKLAISLGTSATHELIYFGVPVITLRPKSFDERLFPEVGSFYDSVEGRKMAIETIVDVLGDPKIESNFINRQRAELETTISEATGTLQWITDFVLEQASTAQRRP